MKKCLLFGIASLLLAGCTGGLTAHDPSDVGGMTRLPYLMIDQEEAARMMEQDDGHVVVDVRTLEEYDEKHIPGAICIPNETIGTEQPALLPDLNQIILVYCRSGNRSKQAAEKLGNMGYLHVYEFGGINTWTGPVIEMDREAAVRVTATLVIEANGRTFYADLEDNPSAKAFIERLDSGAVTVDMHDYGSFEKVGTLPWELVRSDEQITTQPGDVILYQGNQITIYYDENSWDFTRLARIQNVTGEELLDVLGDGDVTVSFRLEWSE